MEAGPEAVATAIPTGAATTENVAVQELGVDVAVRGGGGRGPRRGAAPGAHGGGEGKQGQNGTPGGGMQG